MTELVNTGVSEGRDAGAARLVHGTALGRGDAGGKAFSAVALETL